ncbi:MAG: leucine-rich repeat domain-containing protein [Phycisphaerales bacterium]
MSKLLFVLILSAFLLDGVQAEEPIFFEDPNLKEVIEEALWISDPAPTNMLDLIPLSAGVKEIESLVGIEYATNLRDLYLRYNRIRDLSPLAGLTGREPNDPNGTELPVIRADHNGVVVLIAGNSDTYCTLSGFAITAGTGQAGIISCSGTTEASRSR